MFNVTYNNQNMSTIIDCKNGPLYDSYIDYVIELGYPMLVIYIKNCTQILAFSLYTRFNNFNIVFVDNEELQKEFNGEVKKRKLFRSMLKTGELGNER